jgi:putative tricarboxylic transport membrane protein
MTLTPRTRTMERRSVPRTFVLSYFIALLTLTSTFGETYPDRPIKIIVPFSAGGGSDTFVRIMQRGFRDHAVLAQPLVVINVPGAGGTIGSRQVKNAHPDGYTLLNLHEGILSARYSGTVAYGPEAFIPIAGTGKVDMILGVADKSPYANLRAILDEAAAHPDTILLGANIGAPSHFAARQLEMAVPGARFRYVQSGGGAKRFGALTGGHIDASIFSVSEYAQFQPAGLRALAVLSDERQAALPDVLTAMEQGVPVVESNMQFWWAPKGTAPERVQIMVDALKAVMLLPNVRADLERLHVAPVFLSGAALAEEIRHREQAVAQVKTGEMIRLPNLPSIVGGLLLAIGILLLLRRSREVVSRQPVNWPPAAALTALTVVYVLIMDLGGLSFMPATLLFLLAAAALLGVRRPKAWLLVSSVALVVAVGCTWLFTQILVVDLP